MTLETYDHQLSCCCCCQPRGNESKIHTHTNNTLTRTTVLKTIDGSRDYCWRVPRITRKTNWRTKKKINNNESEKTETGRGTRGPVECRKQTDDGWAPSALDSQWRLRDTGWRCVRSRNREHWEEKSILRCNVNAIHKLGIPNEETMTLSNKSKPIKITWKNETISNTQEVLDYTGQWRWPHFSDAGFFLSKNTI